MLEIWLKVARLDFLGGGYLPSLSINYVAMSKDMGKRLPQLYYVKMKISFDLIIPSFFFFPFFVLLFSIHINYS